MMKKLVLLFLFGIQFSFALPPTGDSPQTFCDVTNPTIADIVVNGSNILWFDIDDNSGTPLDETTLLVDGETYYAFDSTDVGAESLAVTIEIQPYYPAPIAPEFIEPLCNMNNDTYTLADVVVFNTDGYNEIFWFDGPNQESSQELPMNTILVEGETYYAFQGVCNCDSPCLMYYAFTFEILQPVPAPIGDEMYTVPQGTTIGELPFENTTGISDIYFFNSNFLAVDNMIPSSTILEENTTYYAAQAIGSCVLSLPFSVQFNETANINESLQKILKISNPIVDKIRINVDDLTNFSKEEISVFSVSGKKLPLNYNFTNQEIVIDMTGFSGGIYFLKIKYRNQIYISKIIKM